MPLFFSWFVLLPLEAFYRSPHTDYSHRPHHGHRQPKTAGSQSQESRLHQLDPLGQRKDRHDFLYNAGHNLQGQRCAGEDQYGEVDQAGDYAGGFCVPGDSPSISPILRVDTIVSSQLPRNAGREPWIVTRQNSMEASSSVTRDTAQ